MKTCKRFYNLFYDEDRYEKIKKYIQHNYTKYCEYFIGAFKQCKRAMKRNDIDEFKRLKYKLNEYELNVIYYRHLESEITINSNFQLSYQAYHYNKNIDFLIKLLEEGNNLSLVWELESRTQKFRKLVCKKLGLQVLQLI